MLTFIDLLATFRGKVRPDITAYWMIQVLPLFS